MSETITETGTETTQPAAAATAEPAPESPAPEALGDAGKAALSAERKARREAEKRAQEYEAKVKEFEQQQLSDQERLTKQLEEARADAATAKAEALRLRIAAETDLPADLHEFLVGSDEADLRAKAEKLKAATAAGTRRPQPDPSQGAKPDSTGSSQLTAADLATMSAEEIVKADEAGRFDELKKSGR
jgi:hypothetical protein